LWLHKFQAFLPLLPSCDVKRGTLVTVVGYPGFTSSNIYINLYARSAMREEAEKECKLIHKYVYRHFVLSVSGGLNDKDGDRIGHHTCLTSGGCSGLPLVLTSNLGELVGIHQGLFIRVLVNHFYSANHPFLFTVGFPWL
jgi:hypothetical protein